VSLTRRAGEKRARPAPPAPFGEPRAKARCLRRLPGNVRASASFFGYTARSGLPSSPERRADFPAAESFNDIALFGPAKTSDTIRFEDLETQDAAEIERPALPVEILGSSEGLSARIADAREKNHREQMHIERMMEYDRQHAISEEFHLGHLTTPVEASRAADLSRETLLDQGQAALAIQANAQQESVLRLFH